MIYGSDKAYRNPYGSDKAYRNHDNVIMIEINNLLVSSLHMIEITGMYEVLGRNMCQDLSELLWFYIHIYI